MMRLRASGLLCVMASLALHGVLGGGAVWLARHPGGATHEAPAPAFAGETFDIARVDEGPREIIPIITDPVDHERDERGEVSRSHPHAASHGLGASHTVDVPLTYGAVGDRSASSLLVALSRGFPQAASTDAIWQTVPFGDAGSATIEVELAADGSLARWSLGPGASPALRQAMVRTMALIGGRTFIARSAQTKLHLTARVTPDAVRDGNDAVYAIHSEHEGDVASAYFSLSSGRRVDLTLSASLTLSTSLVITTSK